MLRCCERCDGPKTAVLIDGPDIPGVFTNPVDERQGDTSIPAATSTWSIGKTRFSPRPSRDRPRRKSGP